MHDVLVWLLQHVLTMSTWDKDSTVYRTLIRDMFLVRDLAGHGVLAQTSERPNDV